MPHPKAWHLPEPENDTDFEVIFVDVFEAYRRPVTKPQRYGRNGQKQWGLDFVLDMPGGLEGYQCKCTAALTFKQFCVELKKTKAFPYGKLKLFTLLTSAPPDAKVQGQILALSQERQAAGECPVGVLYWPALSDLIVDYPEVFKRHYNQLWVDYETQKQGELRRLDREFPGTTLTVTRSIGGKTVVVNPGPSGIPISSTVVGMSAKERLDRVFERGESAEFSTTEFRLSLPESLAMVLGREPTLTEGTVRITPTWVGRTWEGRVVVGRRDRFQNIKRFRQEARRPTSGVPARFRVDAIGSERLLMHVQCRGMPLSGRFEETRETGESAIRLDFNFDYTNAPISAVLDVEETMHTLASGGFLVLIIEDEIVFASQVDINTFKPLNPRLYKALERLSAATGLDLCVPEAYREGELVECETLADLLLTGRSVRRGGGSLPITVHTENGLDRLRDVTKSGALLFTTFEQYGGEVELFGQTFPMPNVKVSTMSAPTPESAAALAGGAEPPFTVTFQIPSDIDIVQEVLVDGQGAAEEFTPSV